MRSWSDFPLGICSQGERLTVAFNHFQCPLSEGRILMKMIYLNRKFCESQCREAISACHWETA